MASQGAKLAAAPHLRARMQLRWPYCVRCRERPPASGSCPAPALPSALQLSQASSQRDRHQGAHLYDASMCLGAVEQPLHVLALPPRPLLNDTFSCPLDQPMATR